MSRDEAAAYLSRARESLQEARELLGSGHQLGAISRAYYAMYQAAQAVLAHSGLTAKTHKGVRTLLDERALLDRDARTILARAQALREQADYNIGFEPDEGEAAMTVERAAEFLTRADQAASSS